MPQRLNPTKDDGDDDDDDDDETWRTALVSYTER
jgi:hypothetical protein